ncbi:serine hydrolase domain-containing protein [Arenimonas terrae]|uniref:Class A beta-lactamase-related serine hydrolase n=1 Tax=Arenimonas terrae TaxID=2546226 RepID=A0A5C4RR35_9GAMM|nr:serine hydrolase domain-containing protein [Arenimonas terrae]TNJ33686.1 class A beta-lactamase-related serine hydrolase [Arenimonas terrae]
MTSPTPVARPSLPRRLLRHLVRFLLLSAVLLGPNLVFFGRWHAPTQPIPAVAATPDDQRAAAGLPAGLASDLAATLRESRDRAGLPSLSAAIAFDGQLQWAGATGLADIEAGRAATVASRYRTGSVAKPITAVALMRLVEAGKLDLDAPLSTYLPQLPDTLQPITARQLASHRGGIRHYSRLPAWWMGWHESYSRKPYVTVADGLELFVDDAPEFAPGTGFLYSTFGYSLLSRQMEAASGRSFPELLQDEVFAPAGMNATAVDRAGDMPERVAFYEAEGGRYTPSYPIDSSYKIAGGGLVSTPSDLVRLGQGLLGDRLLSEAGRQALWTPLALADGTMNPENYGVGWRIDTSTRLLGASRPTRVLHHGGTQPGAAAFFMLVPEHGIVVTVMSNSGTGTARAEAQEAAYALVRQVVDR